MHHFPEVESGDAESCGKLHQNFIHWAKMFDSGRRPPGHSAVMAQREGGSSVNSMFLLPQTRAVPQLVTRTDAEPTLCNHPASPITDDLIAEVRVGQLSPRSLSPPHMAKTSHFGVSLGAEGMEGSVTIWFWLLLFVSEQKEMTGKAERRQIKDFQEAKPALQHWPLGQPLLGVLKYKVRD